MAENLKTSSYSNGDPILHEIDSTNWLNLDSGAFCWLDNNDGNDFYGKLYNWYAVQDSRNLCPTGWHVPTNAEWNELTDYIKYTEAENVYVTHGREDAIVHWCKQNKIQGLALSLSGRDDENEL